MARVLVVEDEWLIARALERFLARQGAEVKVITDSLQFETAFISMQPTIVISDFLMPEMDGITVLTIAKRLLPATRRCLLSGSLSLVTPAQRLEVEPCVFLEKPCDRWTLVRELGLVEITTDRTTTR